MSFKAKLTQFLLQQLFTLYHFGKQVVRHEVYFNRTRFRRIHEYLPRYALFQYRSLHPVKPESPDYPLTVSSSSAQIQLQRVFWLFYLLRGALLMFFPGSTRNQSNRVLLGVQMWSSWSRAGIYIEAIFTLWSIICFGYLVFSLTDKLLDYKFLSVFAMSDQVSPTCYLIPVTFSLTQKAYQVYARFRRRLTYAYLNYMFSLPLFAIPVFIALYVREGLFSAHPLSSTFWSAMLAMYSVSGCATIYGNLLVFIVVAKYLQIKQNLISILLTKRLSLLSAPTKRPFVKSTRWLALLRAVTRYAHLQEELVDYNRFWRLGLSLAFINCCTLISYITFLIFLSPVYLALKYLFGQILAFHLALFACLIYQSATLVCAHQRLNGKFTSSLATFARPETIKLTTIQHLKLTNVAVSLSQTQSGFTLLNGYLITSKTFQLIFTNIIIYFMLSFHP